MILFPIYLVKYFTTPYDHHYLSLIWVYPDTCQYLDISILATRNSCRREQFILTKPKTRNYLLSMIEWHKWQIYFIRPTYSQNAADVIRPIHSQNTYGNSESWNFKIINSLYWSHYVHCLYDWGTHI
jgi:hypothetical protein